MAPPFARRLNLRTARRRSPTRPPDQQDTRMRFTKAEFLSMKEDALRERVLVPLFRAMGFRDVNLHHGSIEFGKDIVMWKLGELSVRVNYAVVAKRGKISGRTSGSSSAAEVCSQVRKSFGAAFSDARTGERISVNHVYVVASGDIP